MKSYSTDTLSLKVFPARFPIKIATLRMVSSPGSVAKRGTYKKERKNIKRYLSDGWMGKTALTDKIKILEMDFTATSCPNYGKL
ncbi:MAG: hypothetical protein HRF42_13490 [Candidatus Brocadia sp.]|jgi:predicted chitinase